jgi:hypothetical protein
MISYRIWYLKDNEFETILGKIHQIMSHKKKKKTKKTELFVNE